MTERLNIDRHRHEETQLLVFEYLGRIQPLQGLMTILVLYSFTFFYLRVCLAPK